MVESNNDKSLGDPPLADVIHLSEARERLAAQDRLDPSQLTDYDVLDIFLSEATHLIEARKDTGLTVEIVSRSIGDYYRKELQPLQRQWRDRIMGLLVNRLALTGEQESELRQYDSMLAAIDELYASMTERARELHEERRAILALYDLRLGVAQDIEHRTSPQLDEKWTRLLGHLGLAAR